VTLRGTERGALASASDYILENFETNDRIALLVLDRKAGHVTQRITTSQNAAHPEFQAWLAHKNAAGADIYIGMNPLKPNASTRTKEDISAIRHLYLDIDYSGREALDTIKSTQLVPEPNYVVNTSPDKYQIVWRVEGLSLEEAESIQHAMAREFGGDPAATDATRVLRLPGFANQKYAPHFKVKAHKGPEGIYHRRDFKFQADWQDSPRYGQGERKQRRSNPRPKRSQSERDWAYAKRALASGRDPEEVERSIRQSRAHDKHDPAYYAHLTVTKALAELRDEEARSEHASAQPATESNQGEPDH
jgi:hypothetical protein